MHLFLETILLAQKQLKICQLVISAQKLNKDFSHQISQLQQSLSVLLPLHDSVNETIKIKNKLHMELQHIIKEACIHCTKYLQTLLERYEKKARQKKLKLYITLWKQKFFGKIYSKTPGIHLLPYTMTSSNCIYFSSIAVCVLVSPCLAGRTPLLWWLRKIPEIQNTIS